MPEIWVKPKDAEVLQAVKDAVGDLDTIEHELLSGDRSYTTGDRARQNDHWGKRGATLKRLAEVEFLTDSGDWRTTLRLAQQSYYQGLQVGGFRDHWLIGQYVVLRSVVDEAFNLPRRNADRWWFETCRAVGVGLASDNPEERMWAWSSLADLRLVALREGWTIEDAPAPGPVVPVGDLRQMVSLVDGNGECPALWPTFRQFWRWRFWWTKDEARTGAAAAGYEFLWTLVRPMLDAPPSAPTATP